MCTCFFLFTYQLRVTKFKYQCRQRTRTHRVQRDRLSRLDVSFSWSIFNPVAQVTWQQINQHHWVHYGQSVGWLWHHIQALGLRSLKWKNIFRITLSLYCYTEPIYNGSTKWSAAFLNWLALISCGSAHSLITNSYVKLFTIQGSAITLT